MIIVGQLFNAFLVRFKFPLLYPTRSDPSLAYLIRSYFPLVSFPVPYLSLTSVVLHFSLCDALCVSPTMTSNKLSAATFIKQLETERDAFDDDIHPLPKYQRDAFEPV